MIAVIQRVKQADVRIGERITGTIADGLCILLGIAKEDNEKDADFLADKITGLRIFPDDRDKMNRSLKDIGGAALVVSQFTLCGDWRKGRRPGFTNAAVPEEGERLYMYFCDCLRGMSVPVETGEFGAMMNVSLINTGPVTFVLDSKK
ncbi:MAG: D-tyrosyl-tRNA(Tyr) deacylase [FCB group bacterium]|nr:D-tyrosyl-tRNA(Tyr) deacylase [FCB group bacterium]